MDPLIARQVRAQQLLAQNRKRLDLVDELQASYSFLHPIRTWKTMRRVDALLAETSATLDEIARLHGAFVS